MNKLNYEVEVIVNGHPVKEYFHDGKIYVEGRKGNEFSIRIRNNGWKRILAVPTVDGLSVMDGKSASYNSSGYIINGYDSFVIDGWRTSDSDVAKFYFTNSSDSYARRTSEGENVGVIGVAIFRERERDTIIMPICPPCIPLSEYPCWDSKHFCGDDTAVMIDSNVDLTDGSNVTHNSAKMENTRGSAEVINAFSAQKIGTGFGSSKQSEVTTIDFDKETISDAVFTIFYNSREQLEKIGVSFNERPKYVSPRAFPNGYCQPPNR